MKKTKSIKLTMKYKIKPKQLRDALIMTGREYIKAKERQEETEKKLENFGKMLQPQLEIFEKMAKKINEQLTSSGVFETIKKTEEVYSRLLKSYQPKISDVFIPPKNYNRAIFTNEDIETIAEKTTEKILEKIKEASQQNKIIKTKTTPIKLPEKSVWEDIEIRFKNQYDIEVYLKGKFLKTSNHEELGFFRSNTKDNDPDKQWGLLRLLAIIYNNKKIAKATLNELAQSLKITPNAIMKIKENLAKKLQKAFGLTQNPFYEYKEKGEYQTCFTLKPESELRGNGELFITKTRYHDNKEYKKHKEYLD